MNLIVIFLNSALSQIPKQNLQTTIVSLKFISPDDLVDNLLRQRQLDDNYILKTKQGDVKLLVNNSTNQLLRTGDSISISEAKNMIEFLDVAPRQIVIEAKIIELNNKRMKELGFDWQKFLDNTRIGEQLSVDAYQVKRQYQGNETEEKGIHTALNGFIQHTISIGDLLKIIQENGIGKITNTPQIVTINNKTGILLDGSRVTYVARYSSYANIYETSDIPLIHYATWRKVRLGI